MKYKLQDIQFPNDNICPLQDLYIRGADLIDETAIFENNKFASFSTYFNSLSYEKWQKYTGISSKITLELELEGTFEIALMGGKIYRCDSRIENTIKKEILTIPKRKKITITYPNDTDYQNFYFNLKCLSKKGTFFGGSYNGTINDSDLSETRIAVVICTFKKEEYIKRNLKLFNDSFYSNSKFESKDHVDIIVIDNGRTLDTQEIENEHISLFKNINAGGAGGFTRGIIEALLKEKYTHILLMDDDVIINLDAIERTYKLLHALKLEYKDSFLGGAMIRNDFQNVQNEVLAIRYEDKLSPLKRNVNLFDYQTIIFNEYEEYSKNKYAGWWYCVMPTSLVNLDNLPLPFFIRGDDEEYSLRNTDKFIYLNGICVWHEAFETKYSPMMEGYFVFRNALVINALYFNSSVLTTIKKVIKACVKGILIFDYGYSELVLDAASDFMEGISFYKNSDPESVLKKESKKQLKTKDFDENLNFLIGYYFDDINKRDTKIKKFFRYLFLNGYIIPRIFYKNKQDKYAQYGYECNNKSFFMTDKVTAIDPYNNKYIIYEMNKTRAFSLLLRMIKIICSMLLKYKFVKNNYRKNIKELYTIEFWRKYLNIN